MSKKALKSYLNSVPPDELVEQLLFLYTHFSEVKGYYNFVVDPKEDFWCDKVKLIIHEEYFPTKRKKAKLRRSVIAKSQKQMEIWGLDPMRCLQLRLYHIEIALLYHAENRRVNEAFSKAMQRLVLEAVQYALQQALYAQVQSNLQTLIQQAMDQHLAGARYWTQSVEDTVLEYEKIK